MCERNEHIFLKIHLIIFCQLWNQILKKICDHPLILTKRAAEGVLEGMDSMLNREELGMVETMAMNLANMTGQDSLSQLDHTFSCKIAFIMALLVRILSICLCSES